MCRLLLKQAVGLHHGDPLHTDVMGWVLMCDEMFRDFINLQSLSQKSPIEGQRVCTMWCRNYESHVRAADLHRARAVKYVPLS